MYMKSLEAIPANVAAMRYLLHRSEVKLGGIISIRTHEHYRNCSIVAVIVCDNFLDMKQIIYLKRFAGW